MSWPGPGPVARPQPRAVHLDESISFQCACRFALNAELVTRSCDICNLARHDPFQDISTELLHWRFGAIPLHSLSDVAITPRISHSHSRMATVGQSRASATNWKRISGRGASKRSPTCAPWRDRSYCRASATASADSCSARAEERSEPCTLTGSCTLSRTYNVAMLCGQWPVSSAV